MKSAISGKEIIGEARLLSLINITSDSLSGERIVFIEPCLICGEDEIDVENALYNEGVLTEKNKKLRKQIKDLKSENTDLLQTIDLMRIEANNAPPKIVYEKWPERVDREEETLPTNDEYDEDEDESDTYSSE